MIRVSSQRDPLSPIERSVGLWGVRCTARRLAPGWADPDWTSCSRNGALVTDWDAQLQDGDHVHYWTRPGFPIVVGSQALAFFGNLALGFLYSFIAGRLLPPKAKPLKAETPSQSFNGLSSNARGDGLAIPVLYGRHRVTSPIVNEYIRSSFDTSGVPTSEYLALLLISEGPIKSVGNKTADGGPFTREAGNLLQTLQINGQPAENFEGVEAHVRLGNLDQTTISEFADPVITRDIGTKMSDPVVLTFATGPDDTPSTTTAIATTGHSAQGSSNVTKWTDNDETSMVSFVGTDIAEEFTLALNFPNGLISFLSDGTPQTNSMIYQARYVEVDDGGTPFGDYIILPARKVLIQRESSVTIEDRQRTYTASLYSPPTTGLCVQSRAPLLTNPGVSYTIDTTKFAAQSPATLQFSFACWIRRIDVQASLTTSRILHWLNGASLSGFAFNVLKTNIDTQFQFLFGTGASLQTVTFNSFAFPYNPIGFSDDITGAWHHLVATYEANFDNKGTTRIRVYTEGILRATQVTLSQATLDAAQPIRLMTNSETSPTLGYNGKLDETTLWSRALTPYEVASLYNGGLPIGIDAAADGLIVGAEFDTNAGSTPNIGSPAFGPAAFTTGAAANWRFGTGTNASSDPNLSTGAIVKVPLSPNVPKSGKWRVDVMRLSQEDTSQRRRSDVTWTAIQWRTFEPFEYPGVALVAVKVTATDQLSGQPPTISVIAEGRLIPVWDGSDPVSPNMPATYSQSPAWVAADIALSRDYGIGDLYKNVDLDVGQFKALATLAGTRIYDNSTRQLLLEARQLDSADVITDVLMTQILEDCVRYRLARLPANFPPLTAGRVSTGVYLTLKITGTPNPVVPAWLSTHLNLGPQEVIYVFYDTAAQNFRVYVKSTTSTTSALYTTLNTGVDFIEVERRAERFRFDGYFDQTDTDTWEALQQVLSTARSAPMRLGSRLSVFIDDVASPVALIGMGSIIEGSWRQTFQDVRERPNAESAEFFDEERNYERDSQPDEHPELVDPSKESGFRWRRIRIEGITRRGQIKRYLRRDLNASFLLRRSVEFELGIDGLAALAGDVIAVAHDVPGYGISGRIWEDASVGTSIKLDRAVTLEGGKSYQIQVESIATEVRETKPVTSGAATYAAGATITIGGGGFSTPPDKNDEYALGEVSKGETKVFRILETTLNPRDLRRRVKCIEYNADVYDDDFGTLPEVATTTLSAPSAPSVPAGVENLSANELTVKGPDGSVRIGVSVGFTHYPETYHAVGYTDVYVSTGDHTIGLGAAKLVTTLAAADVHVDISGFHFARYQVYTIWVVPRTRDGATAYRSFATFVEFTPSGLAFPPLAPADVRASVAGDLVTYAWDDPGDGDQGAIVEARQGGWIMGLPLFIAPAQGRHSLPISVWNSAPTNAQGVAETPILLRTKIGTGQYSDVARLDFAPTIPSADGNTLERNEEDGGWA